MSNEFEDVFSDEPKQQADVAPEQQPATAEEVKPAETEVPVNPETDDDDEDATAASEQGNGAHVPLIALQKTRQEKKDWKEKAIRFETEVRLLKEQAEREKSQASQAQQQSAAPQGPLPPDMALLNERMNMSEVMAREKYADLDEKVAIFMEEAQRNPALAQELKRQTHPYDYAYKHATKVMAMKEIGDDPTAYKKRIEEQIRAELQGQQTQQPASTSQAVIPQSLAGARSSAPRNVGSFTGAPAFDDLFK